MVADCTEPSTVAPAGARTRCGTPVTVMPCRARAVANARAATREGSAGAGAAGAAAFAARPSAVIGPTSPDPESLGTQCEFSVGPLNSESSKPSETRCVPAVFSDAAVCAASVCRPAWPYTAVDDPTPELSRMSPPPTSTIRPADPLTTLVVSRADGPRPVRTDTAVSSFVVEAGVRGEEAPRENRTCPVATSTTWPAPPAPSRLSRAVSRPDSTAGSGSGAATSGPASTSAAGAVAGQPVVEVSPESPDALAVPRAAPVAGERVSTPGTTSSASATAYPASRTRTTAPLTSRRRIDSPSSAPGDRLAPDAGDSGALRGPVAPGPAGAAGGTAAGRRRD